MLQNMTKRSVNATSVPRNPDGSLKPRSLRLQERIFPRWSGAGSLWPIATIFQSGYQLSQEPFRKRKQQKEVKWPPQAQEPLARAGRFPSGAFGVVAYRP
jgi:hypothetical protein